MHKDSWVGLYHDLPYLIDNTTNTVKLYTGECVPYSFIVNGYPSAVRCDNLLYIPRDICIDKIIEDYKNRLRDVKVKQEILTQLKTPEKPQVNEILEERENTHGSFEYNAGYSQTIKEIVRDSDNWSDLQLVQKEALEVIVAKMARILSGNPDFLDHWDDIAGYATLVSDYLKTTGRGK